MSAPTTTQSPSDLQTELATLVADLIGQKPTTQADALVLLQNLDARLTTWLITELPVAEQKAILAAKWAVQEVKTGCKC